MVFTIIAATTAARITPTWIPALDSQATLFERIFSLRVQGLASFEEAALFDRAEHALGAQNGTKIHKILLPKGKKPAVTL